MMGVVYHANYLLFFEDGRTSFLNELGFPYAWIEQAGYMSPVIHMECNYREPLRYGEVAIVRTRIVQVRPTKTIYAYEIFREGQNLSVDTPLASGSSTHCLVESSTFKPVSMKKALPTLYNRYLEVVEPEALSAEHA